METFKKISDIVSHLKAMETANKGLTIEHYFKPQDYVQRLFSQANELNLDKNMNHFEQTTKLKVWDLIRLDEIALIVQKFKDFFATFSTVDKEVENFQVLNLDVDYVRNAEYSTKVIEYTSKGFELRKQTKGEPRQYPMLVVLDLSKKKIKIRPHRYEYEQTNVLRAFFNDPSIELNKYSTDKIDESKGSIKRFQNGNIEIQHINLPTTKSELYKLACLFYSDCTLAIKY